MPAAALAFVVLLLATFSAQAIDLERLVMPGPLIEGHADLQEDCENCHQAFDRGQQRALCLDCHEDVAADVSTGEGFHGLSPAVRGTECRHCHTDHKGRAADILSLNPDAFDHRLTDFELIGRHTAVACGDCHPPEALFRDAPLECGGCHDQDDPHGGRLGDRCSTCHAANSWREAGFNHDETGFPLEGRHQRIDCNLCHAGERYEDTPSACRSCHSLEDAHRGNFGGKCQTCHTPARWDRSHFDHNRSTKFALHNRHAQIDCRTCHTGHLYKQNLKMACVSCHRSDDVHRRRNGNDCRSCHSDIGWAEVQFDHDGTDFPLKGAHEDLRCELCHQSDPKEEELAIDCYACHAGDDVHKGEQGETCGQCHNERGWSERIFFDHDITRFPLLGVHAVVACEDCHSSTVYRETDTRCIACHAQDDFHKRTLGTSCSTCHNPNGWPLWDFDHNSRTAFALHGAHEDLNCRDCHTQPVNGEIRQSEQCASCHRFDDIHDGRFGTDCDRCHTEQGWERVQITR